MNNDTTSHIRDGLNRGAAAFLLFISAIGISGCQALSTSATTVGQPGAVQSGSDSLDRGVLPKHATAFDEELPGIGKLEQDLRTAVQNATEDARADDVEIFVNSGWRSPELQKQLLDEAVAEYGSREEAARWVSTPETSAHVTGNAIDLGEMDAYLWLSDGDRGSAYGLCQIYSNEPWHFEYISEAPAQGCPEQYLDPTHDPRNHG